VITILDQVLRLQPEHGEALALMGLSSFLIGKWDECERYGKLAQAAGDKAKNKGWRDTGDFLLANLERKRMEKKAEAKSKPPVASKPAAGTRSGLKRAPTVTRKKAKK
jgi:hypothetical protein